MGFTRNKRLGRWPSFRRPADTANPVAMADFDMLFEATPTPILVIDKRTLSFRKVNAAALQFYGYGNDEFLQLTLPDIRPESTAGEIEGMVGRLDDPALAEVPRRHVTKSGEERIVKVSARVFEYDGAPAILAAVFDATREHELQKEARSARTFLANVVERVPIALFVKEAATGRFVIYNSGAERLFNVSRQTLIGNTSRVFGPDEAREFVEQDKLAIEAGPDGAVSEKNVRNPDGTQRVIRIKKVAVEDGEDEGKRFILAVAEDVTEERLREAHVAHLASHDNLTGLANRWLFQERLESQHREMNTAAGASLLALHCVDLDGFKLVNDEWGHPTGDQVLKTVAARMRSVAGTGDLVARLGGDEFAVLQRVTGMAEAQSLAARLVEVLAEPYIFANATCRLGGSVGVCLAGTGIPIDQIIDEADRGLYAAKRDGKSRYVVISALDGAEHAIRAPEAEAEIRQSGRALTKSHPPPDVPRLVAGGRGRTADITASFAKATDLALISIDASGVIEFVNPSAARLFGYGEDEMMGAPITIIVPERMRSAHSMGLARVAAGNAPNLGGKTVEVSAVRKDGTEFPIEITLSVWRDERGMGAGAIIKDITERREREGRLLRLASQDVVTGLHNRHRFTDLLKTEIGSGRPSTLIMLGIDGLGDVNDMHGHAVGDALLSAIGVRLRYLLRPDAEIARFGGDTFSVLLPGIGDPVEAGDVAASIVQAFTASFGVSGHMFDLGANVGFAIFPSHGRDEEEWIAGADFALQRAKAAGGRTCRMFEHSMRSEPGARRAMRSELLTALRRGELALHYQPQVNLRTGAVFGLEALIRWQHPERGLLLPGAFLPALEQSMLALEIGWWTLDQACCQIGHLRDCGHPEIKVGVNLFPAQFNAANLVRKVSEAIEKHRIDPCRLELEITESIALHDDGRSFDILCELRALGVGIAFDDFGTGYASLSSLQRYPLSTLKIDRGFVRHLMDGPKNAAIIRALIAMSRDLELETIAEGIETAEQEAALLSLGCPSAQGYRYGRPMPASDIDAMLTASSTLSRASHAG